MTNQIKPSEVKYHCICGCVNAGKKNMVRSRTPDGYNGSRRLRCRKHSDSDFGNIAFKSQVCGKCGKYFELKASTRTAYSCPECSRKRKIKQIMASQLRNKKKPARPSFLQLRPIGALNIHEAIVRDISHIPSERLFRFNREMFI